MSNHENHITPLSTYLIVFAGLILCTVLTLLTARPDLFYLDASFFDLGSFNIVLAMLIASFKASLVLMFFMHLYYDNKLNLALILGSVVFVGIFIAVTMLDVNRREVIYDIRGKLVNPDAKIYEKIDNSSSGH
tara:strand:- start:2556 stop:2954 length:399 start_codon:yes stop_codon:yes gene_type:complete